MSKNKSRRTGIKRMDLRVVWIKIGQEKDQDRDCLPTLMEVTPTL
jgi:hypothetical protein